jgi:hypothetical protein
MITISSWTTPKAVLPNLRRFAAITALALGMASPIFAQSDNFDSGSLNAAWKQANFNPALVQTSFPATGTGKGLRIRANPVPGQAPAAALFYRDDVYTDFYVAVDIANWPGTDLDQAMVLFGRGDLSPNLLSTRGVICNYDASQDGQDATSRRQGQFQINLVTDDPPFSPKTIAAAEITLIPGRSYRMTLAGVGSVYTAKLYDHEDLTRPLVTIHGDDVIQGPGGPLSFDVPFTSGKCGFLSFSRDGNTGVTDVTIDNYFAAATDPNPAASPALAHPVPGTPTIESRNPAERFKNFWNPTDSITFTAKTYTADVIDAAATKFRLNGRDVSNQLTMSANGATVTGSVGSLAASPLSPNRVYSAAIEVQDVTGTKKSTNTFFFDTFSDAYLRSGAVKTIEAEDFNYDAGQHLAEPIPVSGYDKDDDRAVNQGTGYLELAGIEGIDFHDLRTSAEGTWISEYRSSTPVGLSAGMFPEIIDLNEPEITPVRRSDNVRSQFASSNLLEVVVHRTQVGEWLNYTRDFAAGKYTPYLRVATFGATTVELDKVTSDPTQPDQTTEKLGQFNVPNTFMRFNYVYVPLVNDAGQPVTLDLSGTNTLRLVMAGTDGQDERKLAINYILFAPAPAVSAVTVYSSATVDGVFTPDAAAIVDANAKTITIPLGTGNRFYRVSGNVTLSNTRLSGSNLVFNYQ